MRINLQEKVPAGGFPLPLTPAQRKEARSVLAAYGDFWTQLRFRKGWAEPPFSREDVLPMLERASEIVACIRSELDKLDQGFKLRMIDGSAREFLHGCSYVPQEQPDRFTIDLIHATLQDGRGYVEGLTKEVVDAAIVQLSQGLLDPQAVRPPSPPTPTPAAGAGVGMEGQGLVRTSSVVREEGAITQGLAQEWRGLQEELGLVMQWVGEGWGRGEAKKLLLLRRLLLDLQNTRAHLKDLTALRQQEEGLQQAAAQGGTDEAPHTDTQPTATAEPVEVDKEDSTQPQPQASEGDTGEEDMVVLEPTATPSPPTEHQPQDEEATQQQEEGEEEDGMPVATEDEEEEGEEEEKKKEGAVEIQKVAEDVESLRDQIEHLSACLQDLNDAHSLPSAVPSTGPPRLPSEAVLEALQGRCAKFSQALLHGLNVLDDLQVDEPDKPKRKSQVLQIQQLIDDVEGMREKLRTLRQQCHANKPPPPPQTQPQHKNTLQDEDEEEEDEGEEEGEEEGSEPMPVLLREAVGSLPLKQLSVALEPLWRRMKLRPRIESQRHNTAYLLQSFIPGMRLSDVKVSIGPHATVTMQGLRTPSLKELDALRRQLHPRAPVEALLQAGADRFGSFVETRRLPQDADVEGLQATYEGGVLRVTVPRLYTPPAPVRRPQPHPFGAPMRGYPYGNRGGAGFWGDPDVWW